MIYETVRKVIVTLQEALKEWEPNKDTPWPRFKYLEGEIGGNLTKTRTMALSDDGVIHSLGYKSDMYIKT
jgi:hypothetical protein